MKNLKHIFILFVMMCMLVAASACTKEHSFGEKWMNDETNHWHSCSDEGCEELSDKAAHTFGEGVVTTPATEEAEGVLTSACTVCGYEKTESIPKLPHTHNLSKVDEKSEDCTNNGTEAYYTCSGCELIFSDAEGKNVIEAPVVIPATGHDWEDATCEAPKTCINCKTTEGEKLDHTPAEAVEENRQEATCGSAGKYDSVIKCADCGFEISRETKEIPATGNHVYVTEIERVPAKCEVDGYVVKKCNCGATETTPIKAPGYHTYDNDEDMICNAPGCGYDRSCKHVNTEVIPAVDATCTSNGLTEGEKCKDCGHITIPQTETEMADHTPGDPKEENRSEAGCLEDGSYEKVVKCSVCEYEISRETVVIKALGHHTYDDDQDMICNNCPFDRSCKHTNTEVIPAVAATCTATGLTAGEKCSDCGHVVVKPTVTEKAEHTPADAVKENEIPATCVNTGSYESVVRCSVCGEELSRTTETVEVTDDHVYDDEFDKDCNNGCGTTRVVALRTPDNSGSTKIFKEPAGPIAFDRDGTMFVDGVSHVIYYVYTSADADKADYVAQFVLRRTNTNSTFPASIQTVDGSVSHEIVRGPAGNSYIHNGADEITPFYDLLRDLIGYDYSYGQTYYFAVQAIAAEGSGYTDSGISDIGANGFARDESKGKDRYTITVENGLIDEEYTEVTAGYGVSLTIKANKVDGFFFSGWYNVDENGETTGDAISTNLTMTVSVTGNMSVKAVFTQETVKLDTPDNSAGKLIYKEGTGTAAIAFDRAGTKMFAEGVDHILFYVYTSADADKSDYVARFIFNRYDGAANVDCNTSFATLDGKEYKYVRGGNGAYWITDVAYFYDMLRELIGYDYSYGQNYYFAAQAIAVKDTVYTDSDISAIGANGFARDESKSNEKYTVTVENGLIDGEYATIEAGYGVVITLKAGAFENDEFGVWKYVTYDESGEAVLGNLISDSEEINFTVTSSVTIRAIAKSSVDLIKLDAPDNTDNKMISIQSGNGASNSGIIEYDRQTTGTAFVDGVDRIRYWIFLSDADDADPVAYFDLTKDGYLVDANGTVISAGQMLGYPGNFYSIDGLWHIFIKNAYKASTGSDWNTDHTHYFACQAISSNPDVYLDSEIGAKGTGYTSI